MMHKQSMLVKIVVGAILILILVAACTARPGEEPMAGVDLTPTAMSSPDDPISSEDPPSTPEPDVTGDDGNVLVRDAVITDVQVVLMESWPLQASVQIDGELGDGCTELEPITTERDVDIFVVTVKTTRPADAVCTMELRLFSESVKLDILGLEAGTYTVDVNGVTDTFTLDQDNVAQPDPDESGEEVTLNDEERAELLKLTLERALIDQEIPDYGLLEDPTTVVLSTENIETALVPELPGVTLELLTPEEIPAKADTEGDFLYLRFDEITTSEPGQATVSLSNTWAVGTDSDQAYLSGGGFTVEYSKEAGQWTGEVTEMWIS